MHKLINDLRMVGFAEGTSFLILLFIAMPLKYMADMPMAVRIAGSLHGFLFILYVIALVRCAKQFHWSRAKCFEVFIAAVYPFGPFIQDGKLKEDEKAALANQN